MWRYDNRPLRLNTVDVHSTKYMKHCCIHIQYIVSKHTTQPAYTYIHTCMYVCMYVCMFYLNLELNY